MIEIKNLTVTVNNKKILDKLNLTVGNGEIHAIMGPNGSGKSTLGQVIAGKDGYEVASGSIKLEGKNLLSLTPEERSLAGIFLGFQYPIEIPGVNNAYLLKAALNAQRVSRNEKEIDAFDFMTLIKDKMKLMQIPETFLSRSVNEGFSGGEKKRNEILQMLILQPKLCILDETDSGLDVDALKVVSSGIKSISNNKRSIILITHYERLLKLVEPDFVHVLSDGKIVKSGNKDLAHELDAKGYDWVK
ncbi:MAG: Fe-S cluster assembly ATPase SufC [Gammaproteobacteria bacterium TMED78]|nr:MAG: Fe-S cluster assembly ATPase SufC [Gammaproteobacteria bacterium TMED78]|tara:strand:+ start:18834 stop:19571 length:738 start_codon:yes stop_codon:yes gene_type:complete